MVYRKLKIQFYYFSNHGTFILYLLLKEKYERLPWEINFFWGIGNYERHKKNEINRGGEG
ncbi:MAG: hypothetical protein B6D35_13495 [Candidatus Brocadia sp. UTAMX2]|nr:MAG: hypothetical protein B6D35_13495 [Candidatus Brocadia sp. UTAMX2]